jgi:hypothetical protein
VEPRADDVKQEIKIPVSVLANRSVATLEAVVAYLKEKCNLSYHEIAVLLHRDDRTIWTCYHRVQKKRRGA